MEFTSFINAFDLFTNCFVYSSIIYVFSLFIIQLILSFLALVNEYQIAKPDFYEQVKELLNPATEKVFELNQNPCFDTMTLRQLRQHIKDNELQQLEMRSLSAFSVFSFYFCK